MTRPWASIRSGRRHGGSDPRHGRFYEAASARHAQVVVAPTRTANVSRRGPGPAKRGHPIQDTVPTSRRAGGSEVLIVTIASAAPGPPR